MKKSNVQQAQYSPQTRGASGRNHVGTPGTTNETPGSRNYGLRSNNKQGPSLVANLK